MAQRWEGRARHGRGGYRGGDDDRGDRGRDWSDRFDDEMRMGDEEAERHRWMDEQGDYGRRGGYAETGIGVGAPWAPGYFGPYFRGFGPYYGGEDRRGYRRGASGRYGYGGYGQRGYGGRDNDPDERGFLDRAGDEVASWFGDEEAERRRRMDQGHRGRGPKGYTRSDDRIREDVNDMLSDDRHLDATGIEVMVNDREVTLNGTVPDRFSKRHAEDLAESVSGIQHVQNNLRIASQSGAGEASGTPRSTIPTPTGTGQA